MSLVQKEETRKALLTLREGLQKPALELIIGRTYITERNKRKTKVVLFKIGKREVLVKDSLDREDSRPIPLTNFNKFYELVPV